MKHFWRRLILTSLACAVACGLTGCGGRPGGAAVTVAGLAERLVDSMWLAR